MRSLIHILPYEATPYAVTVDDSYVYHKMDDGSIYYGVLFNDDTITIACNGTLLKHTPGQAGTIRDIEVGGVRFFTKVETYNLLIHRDFCVSMRRYRHSWDNLRWFSFSKIMIQDEDEFDCFLKHAFNYNMVMGNTP